MSDDAISWGIFKGMDLRKRIDQSLADIEEMERDVDEVKKGLERVPDGFTENMLISFLTHL